MYAFVCTDFFQRPSICMHNHGFSIVCLEVG